jgi:hypothetical protein
MKTQYNDEFSDKRLPSKWEVIMYLFIALLLLLYYVLDVRKQNELVRRSKKVGTAHTYDCSYDKHGLRVQFDFYNNDKKYLEWAYLSPALHNSDKVFLNRYFPVVFDSFDPDNNRLIVSPEDFQKWNIKMPDSLMWVKRYFDD